MKIQISTLGSNGFSHTLVLALIIVLGVSGFGAYRVMQSSAASKDAIVSIGSEDGCWLAGRQWGKGPKGNSICKATCRVEGTKYNKLENKNTGYCAGHIWISSGLAKCTEQLHRIYISELDGCARKVSQNDGQDKRYCQIGYPYYNADYNNKAENQATLTDICEKSKRQATKNETSGTPGQGQPNTNPGNGPGTGSGSGANGSGSSSGGSSSPVKQEPFRFTAATYNILQAVNHAPTSKKVGNCRDTGDSKSCIDLRSDRQRQIISGRANNPQFDIVGTQETSPAQYNALKRMLPGYGFYPKNDSRISNSKDGNLSILWNKDKFKLTDAGNARGVSNVTSSITSPWVKLEGVDGSIVYVMSVHYAVRSLGGTPSSIMRSSNMTLDWVKQKATKDSIVIVLGDFNDRPSEKLSYCAYNRGGLMRNSYDLARDTKVNTGDCPKTKNNIIDHVYITPKSNLQTTRWTHAPDKDIYRSASDHQPVYATFEIKK